MQLIEAEVTSKNEKTVSLIHTPKPKDFETEFALQDIFSVLPRPNMSKILAILPQILSQLI